MPRIQIEVARREAEPDNADPLVVEFLGEAFTCRDSMNQWTLLTMMAEDADDLGRVVSAFMAFLQDIFVPEDWDRFSKTCRTNRVGMEELQPLVQGIAEYFTATPGRPSSSSSDVTPTTSSLPRAASSPVAAYRAS